MREKFELPNATEMEKQLLAAMFIPTGKTAVVACAILNADDLYRPEHQMIFRAIMRLYAKGFAVSLLNLGTVYHYAPTSSGEKDEAGNPIIKRFGVGFTPSDILKEANDSVELKEMKKEETNPEILSITDRSTGLSDFTLHIGKPVHIKGNRLKLAGENCGVRFAKVSEDGSYTLDGALLIKVEKVYVNEPKSLEFLIPDGFSEGKYRIVISTASGRGSSVNKTMRHYVSDEITLMA